MHLVYSFYWLLRTRAPLLGGRLLGMVQGAGDSPIECRAEYYNLIAATLSDAFYSLQCGKRVTQLCMQRPQSDKQVKTFSFWRRERERSRLCFHIIFFIFFISLLRVHYVCPLKLNRIHLNASRIFSVFHFWDGRNEKRAEKSAQIKWFDQQKPLFTRLFICIYTLRAVHFDSKWSTPNIRTKWHSLSE